MPYGLAAMRDPVTLKGRPDAIIVGVDDSAARVDSSTWAQSHRVPAVFVLPCRDGLPRQKDIFVRSM